MSELKNELNTKEVQLLECLLELKEPVSSQFLANNQGLSSKTIRNNLKKIDDVLHRNGARIESKTGLGYWIEITDEDIFNPFHKKLIMDKKSFQLKTLSFDRSHQILRYLLSKEGLVKIEELDELLYLNRTSVKQNLNRAKSILKKFDLHLSSKKGGGYKIVGSEHDIRCCINYEQDMNTQDDEVDQFSLAYSIDEEKLHQIENSIVRFQRTYVNYNLSTYSVSWLARLIIVSSIRNQRSERLKYSDEMMAQYTNRNSYYVAKLVLGDAEKILNCKFHRDDIILLAIGFIGFRIAMSTKETFNNDFYESRDIAFDVVQELARVNHFDYINKDLKLIESIALHLEGLFTRSKYHFRTTQFIKMTDLGSLMARKLAFQTLIYLNEKYGTEISGEELRRLTYTIRPFFGRYPWMVKKIKACFIPSIDMEEGKGMIERITRNFGNYISQMDLLEFYDLKKIDLSTYDFLFTSYPVEKFKEFSSSIRIISVDMFFDEAEKQEILVQLAENNYDQGTFRIQDILAEDNIYREVDVSNWEECVDVIEHTLAEKYDGLTGLNLDLKFCENMIPSPPSNNVLFLSPLHCYCEIASVAIFILKRPIFWINSYQKAQIIVYWDRGKSQEDAYFFENELLPHILLKTFSNQQIIDNLIQKPDYQFILSNLKKNDSTILVHEKKFH